MPNPSHDPKKARQVLFYGSAIALVCLFAGVALRHHFPKHIGFNDVGGLSAGSTQIKDMPAIPETVALPPPDVLLSPAVVLDVRRPDALLSALGRNIWLQDALSQPVGQGFFGQWMAFLHTRGDSIGADFRDTIVTFVGEQILGDQATRLVLFAGEKAFGTPVLVLPQPSRRAKAAFELLSQAAQRGAFTSSCPSPAEQGNVSVVRWLIADKPVYAAAQDARLVIASDPAAVMQGVCAALPELQTGDDRGVEAIIAPNALGREAQLLATLLGIGDQARMAFTLTENGLAPRGISAPLKAPRLATAALTTELLGMVPDDAPVFVGLQLRLPTTLTHDSVKALLSGQAQDNALTTRAVGLIWYPHGDSHSGVSDVAILWPRNEDKAALQELFSGANALYWHEACGRLVMTSNEAMFARIEATCLSHHPSILHSEPSVVAGLREPTSITLGVDVGRFLAKITRDAYFAEYPPKQGAVVVAPPEIESAARTLLELPWVGMRGTVKEGVLLPGGFRS